MREAILGGLTARAFLRDYWQRRPLIVRAALPRFRDPLTPDGLATLACAPHVESRLVLERGGAHPWQVIEGPQDPRRLRRLPPSHWTLLVQEANTHVPALADLLERFRFLPSWRVDDVMVSFAPRRGTVGPHVDSYDVFLIQGAGRRRWQISPRPDGACRPGLDLRILRRFRAQREWTLEPGDMLYVPPGVAHFGVALEGCFTYSVGFRAPSHADLVMGFFQRIAAGVDARARYRDADRTPPRAPGEISRAALERMRGIVAAECRRPGAPGFDGFVGELLTQPKALAQRRRRTCVGAGELRRRLARGLGLVRSQTSRIAFVRRQRAADLFVDGRRLPLPSALAFAAPLLCGPRRVSHAALRPHLTRPGFVPLLAQLVNDGAFRLSRGGRPGAIPGRSESPRGRGSRRPHPRR